MKRTLLILIAIVLITPCSLSRAEEDFVREIMDEYMELLDEDCLLALKEEIRRQSKSLRAFYHLRKFITDHHTEDVKKWFDFEIYYLETQLFLNKKFLFIIYKQTRELEKTLQKFFKKEQVEWFRQQVEKKPQWTVFINSVPFFKIFVNFLKFVCRASRIFNLSLIVYWK